MRTCSAPPCPPAAASRSAARLGVCCCFVVAVMVSDGYFMLCHVSLLTQFLSPPLGLPWLQSTIYVNLVVAHSLSWPYKYSCSHPIISRSCPPTRSLPDTCVSPSSLLSILTVHHCLITPPTALSLSPLFVSWPHSLEQPIHTLFHCSLLTVPVLPHTYINTSHTLSSPPLSPPS